ncbi:MAG: transposase [Nitrososphaeraceae archaeon]
MCFDVIDSWYSELDRMNDGKRGVQHHYPDSFIQPLDYMRAYFYLSYSQAEGAVMAHVVNKVTCVPSYSTISSRNNNRDIRISEKMR